MKKRKLFALMLGLMLVLSLFVFAACDDEDTGGGDDEPDVEDVEDNGDEPENGDEPDPEPDDEDNGDDPDADAGDGDFGGETITLWLDDDGYIEALEAALNERFPDSTFEFENEGGIYTVDRLILDGPAGIGADIILFPHDHISRAVNQDLLLPLGEDFQDAMNGRIPDDSIGTIRSDGNYFGVPLRRESLALFYNRDLLEANDFEVAESWEDIIEQAEEFNDPANSEFVIRWHAGDAFHSHFILTAHGFEVFGPNHDDPDAVNFDSPEAIAGLEFLASLTEILPVPAEDLNWDTVHGAFVAGEVPYIITGPWSISDIRDNGDFEWGVTTIPTINGNRPITFGGSHIAAISSETDYPDLSRAVLEFMMSDEGLQIMYDTVGAFPALIDSSIIAGISDDPFLLGVGAQAEYSHPMPSIAEMAHFWDPAETMYTAVWEDLLTPEEAAENAMEEYEAARALADN